jgi:hypothetical protein
MATLDGLAALEAELARRLREIGAASDQAMAENAEHLLGEAIQLAPKDLGDLRGSGDVRPLGDGEYEVGFYGLPYALRQHEELDWHHDEGQAKYLEQPFAENMDRYVQNVADAVKKAVS